MKELITIIYPVNSTLRIPLFIFILLIIFVFYFNILNYLIYKLDCKHIILYIIMAKKIILMGK